MPPETKPKRKFRKLKPIAEPTYPCCNGRWNGKFMIQCDQCDVWYHGHCVEIKETEGDNIDKYYCTRCIAGNVCLRIVYKNEKIARCGYCITCRRVKEEDIRCMECSVCRFDKQPSNLKCLANRCIMEPIQSDPSFPIKTAPIKSNAVAPSRISNKMYNWQISDHPTTGETWSGKVPRIAIRKRGNALFVKCQYSECNNPIRQGSKYCSDECGREWLSASIRHLIDIGAVTPETSIAELFPPSLSNPM